MDKINFSNLPSTTTPINATNLNQVQTNVDNAKVEKTVALANPNLNDVTTQTGFYFINQGTNRPEASNGYLLVERFTDNYVSQEYITTSGVKYIRVLRNGTWSDWQHITQPETTTNTNGTAIKYPDGTMICTKTVTANNVDFSTGSGTLYRSDDISLGNFAVAFISAPVVNVYLTSTGSIGFIGAHSSLSASSAGTVRLLRTFSTAASFTLNITAIGRWKA